MKEDKNQLTGSSKEAVDCIKKRISEGSCSLSGEADGI